MRGLTRLLSGILTLLFIVMIVVATGLAWFHQAVDAEGPLKEARTIIIPQGDSSRMIAERLEQHGIISGQAVFLAQVLSQDTIAKMSGQPGRHLKAGEYEMPAGISVRAIIKKLTEGRALLPRGYAAGRPDQPRGCAPPSQGCQLVGARSTRSRLRALSSRKHSRCRATRQGHRC